MKGRTRAFRTRIRFPFSEIMEGCDVGFAGFAGGSWGSLRRVSAADRDAGVRRGSRGRDGPRGAQTEVRVAFGAGSGAVRAGEAGSIAWASRRRRPVSGGADECRPERAAGPGAGRGGEHADRDRADVRAARGPTAERRRRAGGVLAASCWRWPAGAATSPGG